MPKKPLSPHHMPTWVVISIGIPIFQMRSAQPGEVIDQAGTGGGTAGVGTRVCPTTQTKLLIAVLSPLEGLNEGGNWPGPVHRPQGLASALLGSVGCRVGGSPMGPQGSSSRLPSPRRWESELRLASADSGSVLMKLCLWQSRGLVCRQRPTAPCPPGAPLPGKGRHSGPS